MPRTRVERLSDAVAAADRLVKEVAAISSARAGKDLRVTLRAAVSSAHLLQQCLAMALRTELLDPREREREAQESAALQEWLRAGLRDAPPLSPELVREVRRILGRESQGKGGG